MDVSIIGAGIGGLTTALVLKGLNIPFTVYEGAPAIKPVGAGIIMANNAMQVYRHLNIDKAIEKAGNRVSVMNITDENFAPLSTLKLDAFENLYGQYNVAIHRADLHAILMNAVGHENIILNKRLQRVENDGEQYRLVFDDDTVIGTRYLIGADGIRSTVRTVLFQQSQLRDSGQICWRGLTHFHLPEAYHHAAVEAWGRGKRFGFVRINEAQVYWYALVKKGQGNENMDLEQAFGDFHALVLQLLRATGKEAIFFSDLLDLKPIPAWSLHNVCLLGDAAHATTPNLGQGACQAIEDAYVLGQLLKKQTITEAFANYPAIRRAKVQYVVDTSWSLGKIAHWENRFSVALRNGLLKLTPEKINQKQLSKLFALEKV